jgi:hypothetical protein
MKYVFLLIFLFISIPTFAQHKDAPGKDELILLIIHADTNVVHADTLTPPDGYLILRDANGLAVRDVNGYVVCCAVPLGSLILPEDSTKYAVVSRRKPLK